jgi:hypothetical protein
MTAIRDFFGHVGFVWNKNLFRLLILLAVLTALIVSAGPWRSCSPCSA